ncbi:MAG: hypothetical protein AUJ12_08670 [Alphaproteobacteria bacterium CG1_02_46_17]|nr:MAG: hypothetical protein AUJ12_08670 [Alphaproteobacteria bacterium CG1_02_46_17]
MPDFTVEDTVSAFKQCGADIGENSLRAKVANELINSGSKPEAVATHARMENTADAKCVIDTLGGQREEPSTFDKVKGVLKEAFDAVKHPVDTIEQARQAAVSAAQKEFADVKKNYSATARTDNELKKYKF